jgi:hypothetical protein
VYNEVLILGGDGHLIGRHAKIVPTLLDREWCVPGRRLRVFHDRGLTFGCLVCNDLWVTPGCGPYPDPRLTYQLACKGARVIFHSVYSGSSHRHRQVEFPLELDLETVKPGADGGFEVKGLPAECSYRLTASADGYGPSRQTATFAAGKDVVALDPMVLPVADKTISGVVVDEDDEPVAGVEVSAHDENQPPRRTRADAQGKFTLDRLVAGSMLVSADVWGKGLSGYVQAEAGEGDLGVGDDAKVTFPIGTIEGDAEQVRRAFGVRGLPWLILTDKRHVVRAEGFPLTELDEHLEAIGKRQ